MPNLYQKQYCDFQSHSVNIPNTNHYIRKDEYIYASDPCVREFQKRYNRDVDAKINKFIHNNNIRHPNSAQLALIRCEVALDIVKQIKNEYVKGELNLSKIKTKGRRGVHKAQIQKKDNLRESFKKRPLDQN